MAVKIRLARRGRKKMAIYDVIVAHSTSPRDGRFIEKIGTYQPASNPASIELDDEKAFQWLMKGAQPTDTVKAMLSYRGILLRKHLQIGVVKGAVTQEQADARFEEWKSAKEAKITGKKGTLAQQKLDAAKARKEAETKVKEARAEALRKKQIVPEEAQPEQEASEENVAAPEAEAAPTQAAAPEAEAAPAKEVAPEAEAAPAKEEAVAPAEAAPEAEKAVDKAEEAPAEEKKATETEAKAPDAEGEENKQ